MDRWRAGTGGSPCGEESRGDEREREYGESQKKMKNHLKGKTGT